MNLEGNVQLIEACLKTKSELTQRIIYNICDGSVTAIPYGVLDYLAAGFVVLTFLAVLGMIVSMAIVLVRN